MEDLVRKYISADPNVCHGKPCFRETRIMVYLVLELLEAGEKPEDIVGPDCYPELTLEHVKAALHFAAEFAKNQEYAFLERS